MPLAVEWLVLMVVCGSSHASVICFPEQSVQECIQSQPGVSSPSADIIREPGAELLDPSTAGKSNNGEPLSVDTSSESEPDDEDSVEIRQSFVYGRSCLSSDGYSGLCRLSKDCRGVNFSYSRTCGWTYSCCQLVQSNVSPASTTTSRPPNRFLQTVAAPPPASATAKPPSAPGFGKTTENLLTEECGRPLEQFVVGGQLAAQGAFPYLVSFVNLHGGANPEPFCGGVLITRQHVLTAAHCFNSISESSLRRGKIDVRIGMTDLSGEEDPLAEANITKIILHPNYRERSGSIINPDNDISIIKLDRIVMSERVTTVCLPKGGARSDSALVAGWGRNSKERFAPTDGRLRFAYVEEHAVSDCQDKYDAFLFGKPSQVRITREMICAGNQEHDACAGDSGGPLLWTEGRRWTVGGIVSFGPSSCGNVAPGVYTRVQSYLDWIKAALNES